MFSFGSMNIGDMKLQPILIPERLVTSFVFTSEGLWSVGVFCVKSHVQPKGLGAYEAM